MKFLTLLTALSLVMAEAWVGTDEKAVEEIAKIIPDYQPWFNPIWEPPSGEIESLLFSLQAAIGALIIGYVLGYYRGKSYGNS